MPDENKVTKHYLEGLLLDLQDELKEFPLDEVMRDDGIPESVIAQIDRIGETIEAAIELLQEGDDHDDKLYSS